MIFTDFRIFGNFEFSNLLNFVFANSIEKATHVILFRNLSRNPDKISWKIHRKKCKIRRTTWKTFGNSWFIREKMLTIFGWNFEIWAVQKYINLVDLVKSFPTSIYFQKSASIQPRTSRLKVHLIFQPWDLIFTEPPCPVRWTARSAQSSCRGELACFSGTITKIFKLGNDFD